VKCFSIFVLYINNDTTNCVTKKNKMKNLINIFEFDFFAAEADFGLGGMRIADIES